MVQTAQTLLEKAMATHSSTLVWKIPWTEKPGGLQSMGSLRVRHGWATSLSLFTFMHWRRKWHLLQCSCLENPRDGGAWWAAIYGVAQSRTRLKWLSSSSSSTNPRAVFKMITTVPKEPKKRKTGMCLVLSGGENYRVFQLVQFYFHLLSHHHGRHWRERLRKTVVTTTDVHIIIKCSILSRIQRQS